MRTDAARAVAGLKQILEAVNTPGVKATAVYALAQSDAPEARKLLEQIARGGANLNLQWAALSSLARDPNLLLRIYWESREADTRSHIQACFMTRRQKQPLLEIAAGESSYDLRRRAYVSLLDLHAFEETAQLVRTDRSQELKREVQSRIDRAKSSFESSLTTLRTSADPQARLSAVLGLGLSISESVDQALASAYASETARYVKHAIIYTLAQRQAYRTLAATVRDETDLDLKREAIDLLARSDYVKEMLK